MLHENLPTPRMPLPNLAASQPQQHEGTVSLDALGNLHSLWACSIHPPWCCLQQNPPGSCQWAKQIRDLSFPASSPDTPVSPPW